ncbi:hypothetical protein V8C86DRAFT_717342 [Haematococcus lacustris]
MTHLDATHSSVPAPLPASPHESRASEWRCQVVCQNCQSRAWAYRQSGWTLSSSAFACVRPPSVCGWLCAAIVVPGSSETPQTGQHPAAGFFELVLSGSVCCSGPQEHQGCEPLSCKQLCTACVGQRRGLSSSCVLALVLQLSMWCLLHSLSVVLPAVCDTCLRTALHWGGSARSGQQSVLTASITQRHLKYSQVNRYICAASIELGWCDGG